MNRRLTRLIPSDPVLGVLIALLTFGSATDGLFQHGTRAVALTVAASVIAGLAVGLRTRRPVLAVLVVTLGFVVTHVFGGRADFGAGSLASLMILAYSVAIRAPQRDAVLAFIILVAGLEFVIALGSDSDWVAPLPLLLPTFLVGRALRRWRLLHAALAEQSHALADSREAYAALAVRDERARIARELHDVIGHAVSLMIIQASAGRRIAGRDPDAAVRAQQAVALAGRQALDELARIADLIEAQEQPADTLESLAATARQTGLEVQLTVIDPSPLELDAVVARLVQEGLTNALKHAGPTHVQITVARNDGSLLVTIADDGPGPAGPPHERLPGGHGLHGMRERIAATGGTLATGPRPDGGWQLSARLPIAAPTPPATRRSSAATNPSSPHRPT
jgi:signal transduction histidine kinase